MIGHHHPAIRGEGILAPCFLVGANLIVLPAFSGNAAGLDVSTAPVPAALRDRSFRLVAALDGLVLDFGPLNEVRSRTRSLATG
jgi:metallophosphoesterase superfamily enzyme